MISWFLKIKKNKVLFLLLIALAIVFMFDLVALVINLVQIIQTSANPTSLMSGFVTFNIIVGCVNAVAVFLTLIYVIVKRFTKLRV